MCKNKKKQRQQSHFKDACLKRIGQILDVAGIIKKIQNNELEFIDRQSNRITRWKYSFNNMDYMIVYDKIRKEPVTIVPYFEGMTNSDRYWWLSA